MVGLAVGW